MEVRGMLGRGRGKRERLGLQGGREYWRIRNGAQDFMLWSRLGNGLRGIDWRRRQSRRILDRRE